MISITQASSKNPIVLRRFKRLQSAMVAAMLPLSLLFVMWFLGFLPDRIGNAAGLAIVLIGPMFVRRAALLREDLASQQ